MADVIVERDGEKSSSAGLIVGIIAAVLLILAALYLLPGLFNGNKSNGGTTTTPTTSAPTTTSPTTGQ